MSGNFVSLPHKGLRDWVIQRLSAVVLAAYFVFLFVCIFALPSTYQAWLHFFANGWVFLFSILFLLALIFHAWIGVWTIITDYIKPEHLRTMAKLFVWLVLFACFVWGLGIFIHIHMMGSV